MAYAYTPPGFLQNQNADDIHRRMLDALPTDIDKSEGQIPWDLTRPAALEKAEFVEFHLNEAIKLIFPQFSSGNWLDYHALRAKAEPRREANKATGALLVKGIAGTVIPRGFQFATPANLTASVIYETTEGVTLAGEPDENGMVSCVVPIAAVAGGMDGNVPADSVKLMVKPLSGIAYAGNPEAITGGTPEEDDESLIERILEASRRGSSFVGNCADYERWAKEVPGVGGAVCIPTPSGPGTVKLIVVDGNGQPANQQIIDAVTLRIMGTSPKDITRRAPIGAILTTTAPEVVSIDITASIVLDEGEAIGTVTARFENSLPEYWNDVMRDAKDTGTGFIRWVQVGAILANTPGVLDYTGLLINNETDNIPVTLEGYPQTGLVSLSGKQM